MIIGISGRIGAGKDTLGMILQALTMEFNGRWHNDPLAYAEAYRGNPNVKGGWRIMKFADKLKQIASMLLGVPREKFEEQAFKDTVLGKEWNVWRVRIKRSNSQVGSDFVTKNEAIIYEAGERRALQWPASVQTTITEESMTVRQFLQMLGTDAMRVGLHGNVWVNALFADYKKIPNHPPGGGMGTNGPEYYPDWIITDVRFPNEAQAIIDKGGIMVRIERPDNPFPGDNHTSETALNDWKFDMRVVNSDTDMKGLVHCAEGVLGKCYESTGNTRHPR